jgi:hypothetical protein
MALLFWRKNNPQIDAFAQQLANHFFSRLPPKAAERALAGEPEPEPRGKSRKKGAAPAGGLERDAGDAIQQLSRFSAQYKLGVYGKARLHLQFRSRLIELGYSKDEAAGIDQLMLFRGV